MAMIEHRVLEEIQPLSSLSQLEPGTRYVPPQLLTVDEFYELVDEDSPAELSEGVVVMPSPAGYHHEDCFSFLLSALRDYVDMRGLGTVLGSRMKARLGTRTAREPDICFVAKARDEIVRPLEIASAPDLVVEIIASNTGRHEATEKVPEYERAGVTELWLVDLLRQEVTQSLLTRGVYVDRVLRRGDRLAAVTVPGFHVAVSTLVAPAGGYPPAFKIVQELLTEEPDA